VGPAGRAVLARLASDDLSETRTLALLTDLRRDLSPERAGAALTLARLRVRAVSKFSRADALFFTPDALEEASGEIVSGWRARRFADYARVADLGCGVGGDTLALAAVSSVIALDRDALRLQMARANLAAYECEADFVQADLTDPLPVRGVPAAFFDPARRKKGRGTEGRRVWSVRDYLPPLDVIGGWDFPALAVKLSPGVDLDELRDYTDQGAGVEFISLGGELKEAVLWGGAFGFAGRRASRLEMDGSGVSLEPRDLPPPPVAEPYTYLYEPDPAVIRAGLFGELADHLGIALFRLDESIAYLTGDAYVTTPWARAWPVWEWLPFNLKRLRSLLRAFDVGRVTVKKRGSPITPEELIAKLKLRGGSRSAVVVLTHVAGQHSAIVCGEIVD
jgi:SAM-dependent methyltransferase